MILNFQSVTLRDAIWTRANWETVGLSLVNIQSKNYLLMIHHQFKFQFGFEASVGLLQVPKLFARVVPQDQSFTENYAGTQYSIKLTFKQR